MLLRKILIIKSENNYDSQLHMEVIPETSTACATQSLFWVEILFHFLNTSQVSFGDMFWLNVDVTVVDDNILLISLEVNFWWATALGKTEMVFKLMTEMVFKLMSGHMLMYKNNLYDIIPGIEF
ncbi:hypothetical protein ACJX0J_032008, partial [Zea mays]